MTAQTCAAPVREAVRAALDQGIQDAQFRQLVTKALEAYPFVLHPKGSLRAAKLTLGAFQAAGGTGEPGVAAAAAMEMMMAALHLFDGVADGDGPSGSADLQVAIALQFLMGHALERARMAGPSGAATFDWRPIHSLLATVCCGQQRDIDLQRNPEPTLDDAKVMTLQKTGAYGEALALTGAIAAGAGADLRADLALIGQWMGVRGQLVDDASDASMAAPTTSDIALRKKTLPIVFFQGGRGDNSVLDALRDRYVSAEPLTNEDEQHIRIAVGDNGGVEFALTLASWYRMRAAALTEALKSKGCNVQLLLEYIGEVDSSAAGSANPGGSHLPSTPS